MTDAAVATTSAPQSTTLRPARMIFVKLIVSDLDAMIDFYQRAFGLVAVRTIELDNLKEAILQRSADDKGPSLILYFDKNCPNLVVGSSHGPVGLAVEDVDRAFGQAVIQGASPVRTPFDVPGMRVAFVNDPEGHEIEMIRFTG